MSEMMLVGTLVGTMIVGSRLELVIVYLCKHYFLCVFDLWFCWCLLSINTCFIQ